MFKFLSFLFLLLITISPVSAQDFVFETNTVRYVIGADGRSKSLLEKSPNREWLVSRPTPFAAVRKEGKWFPVTGLVPTGEYLRADFGKSEIQADYQITASKHYIAVKLLHIRGQGIEELRFFQLRTKQLANAGNRLVVRWDKRFAISSLGLSDRVHSHLSGNALIAASVYPEYGMEGEGVAMVAAPTAEFMNVVQTVENDFGLPSPTLGGKWAKHSDGVRTSYLFVDLTEANVDEVIRYAKLGGFKYILIYASTWASSLGSYPINTKNFPKGEKSLKAVVDKVHAAGLKVGIHMLTSRVSKNDPLVRPKPDSRLLKDAQATLAVDLDKKATEIIAAAPLQGFPTELAYYGSAKAGLDIQIDNEIIHCQDMGVNDPKRFQQCQRGYAGTKAVPHSAGVKINHLAERYSAYLADLRTSLKEEIADRIAGLINRVDLDMIYFDGGQVNNANGPAWYWVSQQQASILERVKRDLLVQGSGWTHWTWHWFTRGACDDFAAVATRQYLDRHKIAQYWHSYTDNFMPAELGWWALLDDTPDHPATKPEEVEYYAMRMLALDAPISLETKLKRLKANGRAEEMLAILGEFEALRLSGAVPGTIRQRLREDEWHRVRETGEFHPIRYHSQRSRVPGVVPVNNPWDKQPLKFRLQVMSELAPVEDKANIPLLRTNSPLALATPKPGTELPGALIQRVEFDQQSAEETSAFLVGQDEEPIARPQGKLLDLSRHRALAVRLRVDGSLPSSDAVAPVLNVQLESNRKTYRDYYIDLDFIGEKTIIIPEPTTERLLSGFQPVHKNYPFKAAMYRFNYEAIAALNLRWMRRPEDSSLKVQISLVEALAEKEAVLTHPELRTEDGKLMIPTVLKSGDYVEFWGKELIRVFDRNGVLLSSLPITDTVPTLKGGKNLLTLDGKSPAPVKLTTITTGPVLVP